MAGTGVIDDYVSALDARLRGPDQVKADLLTEARDSLADAAEAYREGGLSETAAQRRAVEEFGPVGTIAREFQGELAVSYGARTLRTLLFVVPLAHVMWELNRQFWIGAWGNFGPPPPDWYIFIARANDMTAWIVGGVALVALVTGRFLARGRTTSVTMGRLAGLVAVTAIGATVLGNVAILAATAHIDVHRLLISPPVAVATVISFVITLRLGVLARRCLSCATIVA